MSEQTDKIIDLEISSEVQSSFLDYAMSVITSRALPDVRDGLKPVHRRILYAMNQLGITPNTPYKKSARIVGEIIGKYHPHGDAAVYGTLVRMAQDFSLRYPFVDGHGNFGSIDGDSAAAMRYTEARMTPLALEMLRDLNKETVNMNPNYDGEEIEPSVLPARFPNLLANGVSGIAVGMATNMPPHNLNEICAAIIHAIDSGEQYEVDDLLAFVKGPDFPTAGIVVNGDALSKLYTTGMGNVVVQAKIHEEEHKNGKTNLVVTEIPYMVNKANLLTKIAELVKDKKVDGITDLRDESDRDGMRIVIELKRDAHVDVVKEKLMRLTALRSSFSFKNLVLKDGRPVVLNFKQLVQAYIDHQVDIIEKRTRFDLRKVNDRIHVLEGLKIAQENVDDIIQITRQSKDTETARNALQEKYGISEVQATAILNLRIAGLTGLESAKILNELDEKRTEKDEYTEILSSRQNMLQVLRKEIDELAQKHGDERRTQITVSRAKSTLEEILETIPDERVLVSVTDRGYLKRAPEDSIVRQRRGNRGRVMTKLQDEDFVTQVFTASTRDSVLLFTEFGIAHKINVYDIPEKSKAARGTPVGSMLGKDLKENVQSIVPISNDVDYILFVTSRGYIKKTPIADFENITRVGLNAMNVRPNDRIVKVIPVKKGQEILLCTREGNAIRFREDWVAEMPRDSYGVLGIYVGKKDAVVDADIVPDKESNKKIVMVTADGYGKRVDLGEYRLQRHGGRGVRTTHTKNSKGALIGLKVVDEDDEIVIVTNTGEVNRQPIEGIVEYSRYAQGVKLLNMTADSKVVSVSTIIAED